MAVSVTSGDWCMKKKWIPIAIAAFVVIDIVLVYLAFRHTSEAPANQPGASSPAGDATDHSHPTDPAGQGGQGTQGPSGQDSSGPAHNALPAGHTGHTIHLVSRSISGAVLSAASTPCTPVEAQTESQEPSTALRHAEAGDAAVAELDVTEQQILRVIARSSSNLEYVAADTDCQVQVYRTSDGGASWTSGPASDYWHLNPGPPSATIVSPAGKMDAGCEVVSLSVLSHTTAFIVCVDGTVRSTSDGGQSWQQQGEDDDVVSVSFINAGSGYALAVGEQCAAEVRRTTDSGQSWQPVGCIAGSAPQSIDAVGEDVVAFVDDQLHVSADGGSTWS